MKSELKKYRGKCDKLASKLCIQRDGRCVRCGSDYILCSHHIIYKSQSSYLRHNLDNLITLCRSCHYTIHNGDMLELADWLISYLGQDQWEWLQARLTFGRGMKIDYKKVLDKLSLIVTIIILILCIQQSKPLIKEQLNFH